MSGRRTTSNTSSALAVTMPRPIKQCCDCCTLSMGPLDGGGGDICKPVGEGEGRDTPAIIIMVAASPRSPSLAACCKVELIPPRDDPEPDAALSAACPYVAAAAALPPT